MNGPKTRLSLLRRIDFDRRVLGPEISPETEDEIVDSATGFTHVVVSAFLYPSGLGPLQDRLVQRLAAASRRCS